MAPIGSALRLRKERVDKTAFKFSDLQPLTIHFDGSVDKRVGDANREYSMDLWFARPGDIVLFRTGWRRFFVKERSGARFTSTGPGLGLACCEWLHARDVAAVCSDNAAIEALPGEIPGVALPVHMVLIRDMGMTLGEIFDLEELAADCEADGVWEFFFTAPALKVTRGVGSPLNPLAIK